MASSGSFNTGSYGSGNYNRYLTFSWNVKSQSVSANSTTINWTLKGAGGNTTSYQMSGNFKVIIDGATVYSSATRIQLKNGTVVASGTYTMTHNSSGARSFSAYAEAGINTIAVNCTGSGSWSLPTIARAATISSAPNFSDTDNPTITYSNPAGTSVSSLQACISLTGSAADIVYRDISKTGTSYTFNLTDAERNLLIQNTTGKTRTVYFYIRAVIGGTTLYNSVARTFTVTAGSPTFDLAYKDTNSSTTSVTGDNQLIVQNASTLQLNITNATAYKYATLTNATCTVLGTSYSQSVSSGSANINIGSVNTTQDISIAVTVTDSRGYTTTKTVTVSVLAWSLPTAIITIQRHNNFYSDTDITVDASYASLDGTNTITIKTRTQQVGSSTWSDYTTMTDNVTQTFTLDNNYAWNVQTVVTDKFGSTTYNSQVSRGMPIVYFDRLQSATGFNCFPDGERTLWSDGLPIDNLKFVGSQVLYPVFETSSSGTTTLLGAYDFRLLDGVFTGITIPANYEKAYKITAQAYTFGKDNKITMKLNNISSNTCSTYSQATFREIISTPLFTQSDVTLEDVYKYESYAKQGCNLSIYNSAAQQAGVYNITVHCYLVKTGTNLTEMGAYSLTDDDDIADNVNG